jgi:hypothetical protein
MLKGEGNSASIEYNDYGKGRRGVVAGKDGVQTKPIARHIAMIVKTKGGIENGGRGYFKTHFRPESIFRSDFLVQGCEAI